MIKNDINFTLYLNICTCIMIAKMDKCMRNSKYHILETGNSWEPTRDKIIRIKGLLLNKVIFVSGLGFYSNEF